MIKTGPSRNSPQGLSKRESHFHLRGGHCTAVSLHRSGRSTDRGSRFHPEVEFFGISLCRNPRAARAPVHASWMLEYMAQHGANVFTHCRLAGSDAMTQPRAQFVAHVLEGDS